ncbi:hypothetical protein CS8_060040 [Cupriavidus sp. 8B]
MLPSPTQWERGRGRGRALTELAGFSAGAVPALLVVYGIANVVGNAIVRRFADRYTMPILLGGLIVLAITLAVFAGFADNKVVSVAGLILIGLAGVPMNPAMAARAMRAAHPGPLVNTVHTSVINIGLAVGSWMGGLGIGAGYVRAKS